MGSKWPTIPLGELYEFSSGLSKPREEFGFGNEFLSFKDVFHNYFIPQKLEQLVNSTEQEQSACSIKRGDVFLTRTSETVDELGMSCVALREHKQATFNGFTKRLRPKRPDIIFPEFAGYFFRSTQFRRAITSMSSLSTRASLNNEMLSRLEMLVPPMHDQISIGESLKSLDDKIELNRKMNETLEQMAKALFKSWFVDFDPVRAKAAGRQPAGIDKATADLFPDSFVDSELGKIPMGWRVKTADELSHVGIGKTPPRKEHQWFSEDPTDLPWMSIRDLGNSGVYISQTSEFLTRDAVERFRVKRIPDNTVVLSFKLTMGRVAITSGEMLSNEAIAHFSLKPQATIGSLWLYCYLKGFNYDQLGSTSSIATAINSDSVRGIQILVPEKDATKEFERRIEPTFAQIRNLQEQSRTLSKMRDSLLPKLLAGA